MSWCTEYTTCGKCGGRFGFNSYRETPETAVCPYPACRPAPLPKWNRRLRFQQVGDSEAAAVAIHPETGEVVYCFTDPQQSIPEHYAQEGFVKQQFKSARELERFCRERGLVNDFEYGNRHDGAFEEKLQRQEHSERDRRERMREYQRAREEVAKSMR